jgi:hypothetical protein
MRKKNLWVGWPCSCAFFLCAVHVARVKGWMHFNVSKCLAIQTWSICKLGSRNSILNASVEVFRSVVAEDISHPVTCRIPEERNPPVLAARIREINCMGCNVRGIFRQWYWGTACKGMMMVVLFISLHLSLLFLFVRSLRIQCSLLLHGGLKGHMPWFVV